MEKSKTNKGLVVMVVILSVLLMGAVGYICYDKFMVKEEPVADNEPKEEKLSEEEVMKLHDSLIIKDTEASLYFKDDIDVDKNTNELVEYVLTKYAEENNWKKQLDEFYENEAEKNSNDYSKAFSVSKDEIENMLNKTFNVNKTLELKDKQTYSYRAWVITYSAEDNMFYLDAATTGPEYGGLKNKLTKYEQEGNTLYIYDKFVMCHLANGAECYKTSSYNLIVTASKQKESEDVKYDSNIIKKDYNGVVEPVYDEYINYDYIFENYSDKLNTYKTTFKKADDGKYYWYSSEIVNE